MKSSCLLVKSPFSPWFSYGFPGPLRARCRNERRQSLRTAPTASGGSGSAGGLRGRSLLGLPDPAMEKFPIPSGKHTKNYGKSQFLIGKSTMSMGHFQ